MNSWLEHFAITVILGLLQQVVKNPQKRIELQDTLLGVADDIYMAYGKTPLITSALTAGEKTRIA